MEYGRKLFGDCIYLHLEVCPPTKRSPNKQSIDLFVSVRFQVSDDNNKTSDLNKDYITIDRRMNEKWPSDKIPHMLETVKNEIKERVQRYISNLHKLPTK